MFLVKGNYQACFTVLPKVYKSQACARLLVIRELFD